MGRLQLNRRGFGLLVVILTFFASSSAGSGMAFTIENPDPAEQAGHHSSIKIDAQGSPHIAYTLGTTGELRYASKNGSDWVWETVSTEVVVGADLALDPSGEPWIAFHTSVEGIFQDQMKVAHRSAGAWTIDTIGNTDHHLGTPAIAFDPAGVAHVAWGNLSRGFRVMYASWDGSGWASELVHQATAEGDGNFGLAFDPEGAPHVVVSTYDGVLHAVFVSPSWTREVLPFRFQPSMALDSSGQPHIASIRVDTSLPLIFEYQWRGSDGVWHQEDITTLTEGFPPGASLQLDQDDRPVIAMTEGATNTVGGTLKLFRKPADAWITEEVDASGVGLYPSLALADGVHPRISYSIGPSGLHYATDEVAPNVLAARAFLVGGARTVALAGPSRADLCVQLEPVDDAFSVEDLDPASIVMRSSSTGTVDEITAREGKGNHVIRDRDLNGVAEVGACFALTDLAALFSSLEGRTTVPVKIEGMLSSGGRVSAPLELTLVATNSLTARIYPNPLNPAGRLSLTLRQAGPLRVTLFDVVGRLVRVLADDRQAEAGPREIAFDGMNDRGARLATGIYFYRIESAGSVVNGRIVIAK